MERMTGYGKWNGWPSTLLLFRRYEIRCVLLKVPERLTVTIAVLSLRTKWNPIRSTARGDRLQLKPSKCPLRIRSPIGDGARRTDFLGGLLP